MRVVLQRVTEAHVKVEGEVVGRIGRGLVVLVAIEHSDSDSDAEYLARKVAALRIFSDEEGRMNRSVRDVDGGALVVSQFTLYGDCRKGMRPSFDRAAPPDVAERLYEYFVEKLRNNGVRGVECGVFRASMSVYLVNDGPVTLICDSVAAS